jgi:hypothetical protein
MLTIKVNRLEYCLLPHDLTLEAACIAPYQSCYYAELEFSHSGPATKVTNVRLIIDKRLIMEANRFDPIKLEEGKTCKVALTFPVKEHMAVKAGVYEVEAIDSSGKVFRSSGHFPIRA